VQIEIGGRLGVALANSNLGVLGELQFQFGGVGGAPISIYNYVPEAIDEGKA
jgi:hypothetical protein